MLLARRIKPEYLFLGLFVALFLFTRLPGLSHDNVNPDGVNWHERSQQFVNGLKYLQLEKTYQHYQPGTTLMWITGPTVELVKQLNHGSEVYNEITFPVFHYIAKVTLIFKQLALTIIAFYLLDKFLGWKKSLAIITFLSFEPFFVGNSRVLHLDVLLTFYLLNGLLLAYWHLKRFNLWKALFAGVFFGLAFLTKSVGIGGFLFAAGIGGIYLLFRKEYKNALFYILSILLPSFLAIFILLPAFWVDFKYVVEQIYDGVARVGVKSGHNQLFFGQETRDPGVFFYPLVLFLKTSALLWVGLLLYTANFFIYFKSLIKKKELTLTLYLGIFYLGYLLVMTIGSKKIDRYLIPMFPYFVMLSVYGYNQVYRYAEDLLKNKLVLGIFSVFVFMSLGMPLITRYPYYFTYTNPLFGAPEYVHNSILAQKPFGVGMFEVRDWIFENYGDMKPIALLDPKPMFYLYDKDLVKYSLIDGTRSYDIVVVGVNEELPDKINESDFVFNHEHSIYINGLEYWKIYVKGDTKE